jgi:hydrogenase nickel incorporation protein HypB
MCATCGCAERPETAITLLGHHHGHDYDHDHHHDQDHHQPDDEAVTRTVTMEQRVLQKNDDQARVTRSWLAEQCVTALNLMSSPGSGKTTVLERTIRDLAAEQPIAVIEGDQQTLLDAERIKAAGAPVVQVNTGAGCHLDADMVGRGLQALHPSPGTVVFVENVGNLVCPALFDLGERARVVVVSVTEGDDKPLKYPHMFRAADLVLVNKVDLLPYVTFSVDQVRRSIRRLNAAAEVLTVSALTGAGMNDWYRWLRDLAPRRGPVPTP